METRLQLAWLASMSVSRRALDCMGLVHIDPCRKDAHVETRLQLAWLAPTSVPSRCSLWPSEPSAPVAVSLEQIKFSTPAAGMAGVQQGAQPLQLVALRALGAAAGVAGVAELGHPRRLAVHVQRPVPQLERAA